jgi:hypothetical protein
MKYPQLVLGMLAFTYVGVVGTIGKQFGELLNTTNLVDYKYNWHLICQCIGFNDWSLAGQYRF